jgi:hypothetical protein
VPTGRSGNQSGGFSTAASGEPPASRRTRFPGRADEQGPWAGGDLAAGRGGNSGGAEQLLHISAADDSSEAPNPLDDDLIEAVVKRVVGSREVRQRAVTCRDREVETQRRENDRPRPGSVAALR